MKTGPLMLSFLVLAAAATGGFFWVSRATGDQRPAVPPPPAPRIDQVTAARVPVQKIEGREGDVEFTIRGAGFYGTAMGPFVKINGVDAVSVILDDETRITAMGATGLQGEVEVEVMNPDHQAARAKTRIAK